MEKQNTRTVYYSDYDPLFCSICGKMLDNIERCIPAKFKYYPGYGSRFDGDKYNLKMCTACADKFVDTINALREENN